MSLPSRYSTPEVRELAKKLLDMFENEGCYRTDGSGYCLGGPHPIQLEDVARVALEYTSERKPKN